MMDPLRRHNSGYGSYVSIPGEENNPSNPVKGGSFYGRLGSKVKHSGEEASFQRRTSYVPHSSEKIRVLFKYDEDVYTEGLDIDLYAILFDKKCEFLDCIFYQHPEDANESFCLEPEAKSMSIDLSRVPDECHCIVLAAATQTTGLSLTDVDGGVIEISDGFLGPTLFSVSLQDADSKATESQAGLVFFALSEYGGRWRCRPSETFCRGELDALMRHAKKTSQAMDEDFLKGKLENLKSVDLVLRTSEDNLTSAFQETLNVYGRRGSLKKVVHNAALRNSGGTEDNLSCLYRRLCSFFGIMTDKELQCKSASTEERLQALESTQQTILAQLKRIEDKVDCIVRALEI